MQGVLDKARYSAYVLLFPVWVGFAADVYRVRPQILTEIARAVKLEPVKLERRA